MPWLAGSISYPSRMGKSRCSGDKKETTHSPIEKLSPFEEAYNAKIDMEAIKDWRAPFLDFINAIGFPLMLLKS